VNRVFLLGAGASAEGNIPTSYSMVEKVLELAETFDGSDAIPRAVNYLVGSLIAHFSRRGGNPLKCRVDIEDVVTAALTLGRRDDVVFAAFTKGWDDQVAAFSRMAWDPTEESEIRELADSVLAPNIDDRFGMSTSGDVYDFDDLVSKVIERKGWMWPQVADWIQDRVVKLTGTCSEDQFDCLLPLLQAAARDGDVIATLNQDDSLEHLAKRHAIGVDLGVSAWQSKRLLAFAEGAVRILKLHGSCRWGMHLVGEMGEEHRLQFEFELDPQNHRYQPLILFGERNKLTAEGPYLDLYIEFRRRLLEADEVQIIGYSFRDEHVNDALADFLDARTAGRIVVVDIDPKTPEDCNLGSWRKSWSSRCEFVKATAGEYCKTRLP